MVQLAVLVGRFTRIYLQEKQMEPVENKKGAKNLALYSNSILCCFGTMGYLGATPRVVLLRPFYLYFQIENIQLDRLHYSTFSARFFLAHSQTVLQNVLPDRFNDTECKIFALRCKSENYGVHLFQKFLI